MAEAAGGKGEEVQAIVDRALGAGNDIEGLVILLTYLAVSASAISGALEARKHEMDIVGGQQEKIGKRQTERAQDRYDLKEQQSDQPGGDQQKAPHAFVAELI